MAWFQHCIEVSVVSQCVIINLTFISSFWLQQKFLYLNTLVYFCCEAARTEKLSSEAISSKWLRSLRYLKHLSSPVKHSVVKAQLTMSFSMISDSIPLFWQGIQPGHRDCVQARSFQGWWWGTLFVSAEKLNNPILRECRSEKTGAHFDSLMHKSCFSFLAVHYQNTTEILQLLNRALLSYGPMGRIWHQGSRGCIFWECVYLLSLDFLI